MRFKKICNGKKGQSLVETALVLPIIILMLMGIIDIGMMFNNYMIVGNAAREAARSAATGATDIRIDALVDSITSSLDSSNLSWTIIPAQATRKKGDEVVVTIIYNHELITPVISSLVPSPIQLTGTAAMRFE